MVMIKKTFKKFLFFAMEDSPVDVKNYKIHYI